MKFQDPEKFKDVAANIGHARVSRLSAIRFISMTGIPLQALSAVELMASQMDCLIWSLVPLAIDGNDQTFNTQIKLIEEKFQHHLETIREIREDLNNDKRS